LELCNTNILLFNFLFRGILDFLPDILAILLRDILDFLDNNDKLLF
jgi:hypothetical protein